MKLTNSPAVIALAFSAFALSPFALCSRATGQQVEDATASATAIDESIASYLQAYDKLGQLSGAVLVADAGKVVYRGAFGLANADWDIPNQPDTKFRIASVTKQFTAMLTLLLVKDNKLALDAPITRYLKDYPAESGDKVTIHHLLNHTSGIPSYTSRPDFMTGDSMHRVPVEEFVAKFCSDALEFEPGAEFAYNNSGYFLLGAIAEAVTGKTYAALLEEKIFAPLGMKNSGHDDQYRVIKNRATGYEILLGSYRVAQWIDMTTPYAAGSIYSTIDDLWKWEQALRSHTLLNGELETAMFTAGMENYGYGWFIEKTQSGQDMVWHSGGMPGVSTLITRVPEQDRCVIMLCNAAGLSTRRAAADIFTILDGESLDAMPTERPEVAFVETVLNSGIAAGLKELEGFPKPIQAQIEGMINDFGYRMLRYERPADAVKLFEFNTKAYPTSANTWDSLGEAHALGGRVDEAVKCYGKALELDPESETAQAMLRRLTR